MCLAQGQNSVTPARLEPAAARSEIKHSTTEPLRSLMHLDVYTYRRTCNYELNEKYHVHSPQFLQNIDNKHVDEFIKLYIFV